MLSGETSWDWLALQASSLSSPPQPGVGWQRQEAPRGQGPVTTWPSGLLAPPQLSSPCNRCVQSHFGHIQLFATPRTGAHQAPVSMGFPRQERWSGFPRPSLGDLPNPGITSPPVSRTGRQLLLPLALPGKPCPAAQLSTLLSTTATPASPPALPSPASLLVSPNTPCTHKCTEPRYWGSHTRLSHPSWGKSQQEARFQQQLTTTAVLPWGHLSTCFSLLSAYLPLPTFLCPQSP